MTAIETDTSGKSGTPAEGGSKNPAPKKGPGTELMIAPATTASVAVQEVALGIMVRPFLRALRGKRGRKEFDAMVREVRDWLYREPGKKMPAIRRITFRPKLVEGRATPSAVATEEVIIDGKPQTVEIWPLITAGIDVPYLVRKGPAWNPSMTWNCFLLWWDGRWYAFPIELCPKTVLDEFNTQVVVPAGGQPIAWVKNTLSRPRLPRMVVTPSAEEYEPAAQQGQRARLMFYGGKPAFVPATSQLLFTADPEGRVESFLPMTVEVEELVGHMNFAVLGDDSVTLDPGDAVALSELEGMNPYLVFGRSMDSIEATKEDLRARKLHLLATIGDPANPSLQYLQQENGLIPSGAPLERVRSTLSGQLDLAEEKLVAEVEAIFHRRKAWVHGLIDDLTLEEVLGEAKLEAVTRRRGGKDDVLAIKIAEVYAEKATKGDEITFRWGSPMDRRVRAWVLEKIVERAKRAEKVAAKAAGATNGSGNEAPTEEGKPTGEPTEGGSNAPTDGTEGANPSVEPEQS